MTTIYFFNYLVIRALSFIIGLFPRRFLFVFGKFTGNIIYFFHREWRKKTMTNLYIAFKDQYSDSEIKTIARRSFQNLVITGLEFISLKQNKEVINKYLTIKEGDEVRKLLEKKQGVVFLSAHQANWEVPFLAVTAEFRGVAVGRPIKNRWLYRWVLSVRERFGGRIIMPKETMKAGLKALAEGQFVGIVGDQALPDSNYSYPLFGTRAWTSMAPALLACRANAPMVVATTKREGLKFVIKCSPPIWPNLQNPLKEEMTSMMNRAMQYLEESISKKPEEWLWQHDRWKQQKIDHVKKEYRYAFILIVLPKEPMNYLSLLPLFNEIYPRGFITILAPLGSKITSINDHMTVQYYENESELYLQDWRYQIVFDFYDLPKLRKHFKKLGAFKTLSLSDLKSISKEENDLTKIVQKSLCKEDATRSLFY